MPSMMTRHNPNRIIECDCGDLNIKIGTRVISNGIEHGEKACYYLDEAPKVEPPINRGKAMQFTTFVRKPFVVQAIEVTNDNISEIAKYVGDLREKEDGTPYILVDPRLVPNIERVYPGFFMTKMGENVRCYSRRIFKDQFMVQSQEIKPWVEYMLNGEGMPLPSVPAA